MTGLTTDLVGEHFTQQLTENAEMTKKILEQNYVLSKKESPAGFEPDPAAVPG